MANERIRMRRKRPRSGRWECRDLVGGESRTASAIPGLRAPWKALYLSG